MKKRSIEKKKQQERAKNDRKMEAAITKSWFKAISEKVIKSTAFSGVPNGGDRLNFFV